MVSNVFYNMLDEFVSKVSKVEGTIDIQTVLSRLDSIKKNMVFAESLTSKFVMSEKVSSILSEAMPLLLTQIMEAVRLVESINTSNSYGDIAGKTATIKNYYSLMLDKVSDLSDNVESLTIDIASLASRVGTMQDIKPGDTVRFLYDVTSDDLGVPLTIERGVLGSVVDILNKDYFNDYPCSGAIVSIGNKELVVPVEYLMLVADTVADIYKEIEPELEILEFQELMDDIKTTKEKVKESQILDMVEYIRKATGKEWNDKYAIATKKYLEAGYGK